LYPFFDPVGLLFAGMCGGVIVCGDAQVQPGARGPARQPRRQAPLPCWA
jgi:hypothetical protein